MSQIYGSRVRTAFFRLDSAGAFAAVSGTCVRMDCCDEWKSNSVQAAKGHVLVGKRSVPTDLFRRNLPGGWVGCYSRFVCVQLSRV